MSDTAIRVGGASGFWGDSHLATAQLLAADLDYIVYDYLAEITMSIMARARAKSSSLGYAVDFVTMALAPNLPQIARQRVKVISNAGGVNVHACAAAARKAIADAGLDLTVAVVEGDDLRPATASLAERGVVEMFSGQPFPAVEGILSINAYLGAFPIARALDRGADIVITGRCVDSAVTLGACIHAFGWAESDWDRLAAGTLAGHVIECGPQATGGNFTDWRLVADTIDTIGYPVAEISQDGSFECTKPDGTGGLVSVGTISEQLLYEIGDPQAYVVPDVVCDFSDVHLEQIGPDRVRVHGARGRPAPADYKVCATFADGFRGGVLLTFYGIEAEHKAQAFADAAFRRAADTLGRLGLPPFDETSVEVLGAESQYGCARSLEGAREVVVKLAAKHAAELGVGVLLREVAGLGLATPPGLSGFQGGRPKPSPVVRLFSFLLPKEEVHVTVATESETVAIPPSRVSADHRSAGIRPPAPAAVVPASDWRRVPLVALAWGRSGDKGDKANVGIVARKPEYLPYIWAVLDERAVAERFGHFLRGRVERFLLPGPHAINFVLHEVLGGGGVASLRSDPQGKGYAQLLLDHPIAVPPAIAAEVS